MFLSSDKTQGVIDQVFTNYVPSNKTYSKPEVQMSVADYLIGFSNQSERYCVGCVDIVNSTNITKDLGITNGVRYRQVFLNYMAKILSRFGGFVIKNAGDCLLYYFPESANSQRKFGFMSCVECCLSMAENHNLICKELQQENLPSIDYRISADYGSVIRIKLKDSKTDMMGPPITMCTDINHDAPVNGVAIGGDLHERIKNFGEYRFKQIKDFSLGLKFSYPVYRVMRR